MAQIIGELLIKYFPNQFKIEDKRSKKDGKKHSLAFNYINLIFFCLEMFWNGGVSFSRLWPRELFNFSPLHALQTSNRTSRCTHTQTHMHAHILCHWIERLAQQSCHCSFVFPLIDVPCKSAPTRTHVHMHTGRLYLSPPLNSITFTSFCSACPSSPFFFRRQLKELLWDFVKCLCERFSRPAAWRRFARPPTNPLSCNVTVEKIHCTVLARGRIWARCARVG